MLNRRSLLLGAPALILPYRRALAQCPMGPGVPCATHRQQTFDLRTALPPGWAFTRAGNTATYWNRGTLYTALANVPRFEFDVNGNAIGYENEPAATNLVLYSRDLTNGAWVPGAVSAALNAVGIDGVANSASTITASLTYSWIGQIISVSPSTTYTYSFWAKAESGATPGYAVLDVTHSAWIVSPTVYTPGTGVFSRISVTFTTGATTTSIQVYPVDGMGTIGTVIVDGNQLELGSFATSTIFTAGTAVTRNADNTTFVPQTIYPWWINNPQGYSGVLTFSLEGASQAGSIVFSAGMNASNYFSIAVLNSSGQIGIQTQIAEVSVTSSSVALNVVGSSNTVAFSVGPKFARMSVNHAAPVTITNSGYVKPTAAALGRAAWGAGSYMAEHVSALTLRAGPSSAAQLQAMR